MVCDMKLVSTRTEYGGARAVLYWKKSDEGTWGLKGGRQLEGHSSLYCRERTNVRFFDNFVLALFAFLVFGLVFFPVPRVSRSKQKPGQRCTNKRLSRRLMALLATAYFRVFFWTPILQMYNVVGEMKVQDVDGDGDFFFPPFPFDWSAM